MANWCSTDYVLKGKESEIRELYNLLETLGKITERRDEIHFFRILEHYGVDSNKFYSRGYVAYYDIYIHEGEAELTIATESAWEPQLDGWRLILSNYPSVQVEYHAVEEGCGIYETNEGEHLVHLEVCMDGVDEYLYIAHLQDALDFVNNNFKKKFASFKELSKFGIEIEDLEEVDKTFRARKYSYVPF